MLHENLVLAADNLVSTAADDVYQALAEDCEQLSSAHAIRCRAASEKPKGMWFDEGFDFRDPEGSILTNSVLDMIAEIELRNRQRRKIDDDNYRMLIRKLLSNGLRCFYHRDPPLVACQRKAGSYRESPRWLSGKAVARNTDLLAEAGLIEILVGASGTATTYKVADRLLHAALAAGISEKSITYRLPSARLVRLYRSNSEEGQLLEFLPNDEILKWEAELDDYNTFVSQRSLGLEITDDALRTLQVRTNRWQRKELPQLIRPEFTQTSLYRQFNNGSFNQGGRLYGGWWINCPKTLRRQITIDGKPTIELDYSGCAIRMLYHERGLECSDDPYHLPVISDYEALKGLTRGHFRDAIKKLTQALINGSNRDKDMLCDLPAGVSFSPDFTRKHVMQMIEEKHSAISDEFGSGAGLRLQRKDSDLALQIITSLKSKGIVALPIHDSFIVEDKYKDVLLSEMFNIYRELFGCNPVVN